jgi:hypothetical protein
MKWGIIHPRQNNKSKLNSNQHPKKAPQKQAVSVKNKT